MLARLPVFMISSLGHSETLVGPLARLAKRLELSLTVRSGPIQLSGVRP
jgi:hypothetical protein